ncbi:major facilitator superfamily domain-containing protein [Lentinula raphanica]|nr:major facilitator superfamily domain-containing protein [Lentinula raphanica]
MSTSHEREPLLSRNATGTRKTRLGPHEISKTMRYGILAGVWMATFLSYILNILSFDISWKTVLPSISSEFQASHQASWLGTAYLLATSTFTPLYGRLANVLGRRGASQVAVLFTGLGTIACGLSTNMEMLIASRFLAGIGGGGVNTIATIVVSDMYSLRDRGLAQGVASVFNGLGLGFGGPLGGLITDWLGWRWAFLCQVPLFVLSLLLTTINLRYVTKGKGKSTIEVLKRIDYLGSFTLLISVGSMLFFLSTRFNANIPWSDARVIAPLVISVVFFVVFVFAELYIAPEPVLAPFLLKQRIPVLVGISNFLVALCNFTITYFFPMWFQTVMLTNASTAGLHIFPNSVSMSLGSVFAGWMMHRTGKYKLINMIFGIFPFIGTILISRIREDSGWIQSWFSIIPMGFGNAVVLQTMLIALLAHIPESHMAVGTGFGQLFRGIGQVGGVAISSAIFQWKLDGALRERINDPDAEEIITYIRQNARAVATLEPRLQRIARDSYSVSLRTVFFFASVSTLLAYIARLPIPEKDLDSRPRSNSAPPLPPSSAPFPSSAASLTSKRRSREIEGCPDESEEPSVLPTPDSEVSEDEAFLPVSSSPTTVPRRTRRLSAFESTEGILDLESRRIGGSARTGSSVMD